MVLRHIRYFVVVAEECHFGRAAERLHIGSRRSPSRSSSTRTWACKLLTRFTRKVELTPAGDRYLDRARAILASVDGAGVEANRVASGTLGRLAVGFTGSATYELLRGCCGTNPFN